MEERSQQVRLKGYIYTGAGRVIIWLGESSNTITEAFKMLTSLHSYFWYRNLANHMNPMWTKQKNEPVIRRVVNETCFTTKDWSPVDDLLCRPWFERLWVVQELLIRVGLLLSVKTISYHGAYWESLFGIWHIMDWR